MPHRTTLRRPAGRRLARSGLIERQPVRHVVVAVPARNEAASIAACVRSIDLAASAVTNLGVTLVVGADTCHDDTARLALGTPTHHVRTIAVEGRWHGAGAARAAAVRTGIADVTERGVDAGSIWLASTDADCTVSSDWLVCQLRHAAAGWDAVAGIVRLDPTASAGLRAEFARAYTLGSTTHRHVHAANFGVSAPAYLHAGGWSSHAVVGEEHRLWQQVHAAGHCGHQPIDVVVTTSARTHGRVPGGFATALGRLIASPSLRTA